MNEPGTWEELFVGLCDLAVEFDAETYLYDTVVVMSSRKPLSGHRAGGSIRISRFDDESARVETGWCFDMVVDYVADDPDRPVPALGLVEAICSGNAAEHCLIDSSGEWVGVFFEAWTPTGRRWQSGSIDSPEKRATRRFPSWA